MKRTCANSSGPAAFGGCGSPSSSIQFLVRTRVIYSTYLKYFWISLFSRGVFASTKPTTKVAATIFGFLLGVG